MFTDPACLLPVVLFELRVERFEVLFALGAGMASTYLAYYNYIYISLDLAIYIIYILYILVGQAWQ